MGQRKSLTVDLWLDTLVLRLYNEDLAIMWVCCTDPCKDVILAFKNRVRVCVKLVPVSPIWKVFCLLLLSMFNELEKTCTNFSESLHHSKFRYLKLNT